MVRLPLVSAAVLMAAPVQSEQIYAPELAVAQCKHLDGPSRIAKAQFRQCLMTKTGRPPAPEKAKPGITISGSARIGIVIGN